MHSTSSVKTVEYCKMHVALLHNDKYYQLQTSRLSMCVFIAVLYEVRCVIAVHVYSCMCSTLVVEWLTPVVASSICDRLSTTSVTP
jgi:hypothetical protein